MGSPGVYILLDRFGPFLLLLRANAASQDLLDIHLSSQWSLEITFFNYSAVSFSLQTPECSSPDAGSESLHVFVGTRECQICCSNFCSAALSFALCSLSLPLPYLSCSHFCFFVFLHSRSCLFHRALQSLRINKLYISLCIIPKAPFRKNTQLICPGASVYPKWLHQTWSWWGNLTVRARSTCTRANSHKIHICLSDRAAWHWSTD